MQLAHQEKEFRLSSRVSRDNLVHVPESRHVRLCGRQVACRKGFGGGLRSAAADVEVAVVARPVVQHLHY